jgi:hypothetical protein
MTHVVPTSLHHANSEQLTMMSTTEAKTGKSTVSTKQHPRFATLRRLNSIRLAANNYTEPYVEPATVAEWGILVATMPLEPRELEQDAQFFLPLPAAELKDAYYQRLRDCEDIATWRFPLEPHWAGSYVVPGALLGWLQQLLGVKGYYDEDGLHQRGDWEWLRYIR